jgi:hypothetical protein
LSRRGSRCRTPARALQCAAASGFEPAIPKADRFFNPLSAFRCPNPFGSAPVLGRRKGNIQHPTSNKQHPICGTPGMKFPGTNIEDPATTVRKALDESVFGNPISGFEKNLHPKGC